MPVEYLNLMTGWDAGLFNQTYIIRIKIGNETVRNIPTTYKLKHEKDNANAAIQSVLPELGQDGWELVSPNFGYEGTNACIGRATLMRRT